MAFRMKKIQPRLKVIIITGYADNLSEADMVKSGISEVILKPMVLDDFSKVIRRVLNSNSIKIV